MPLNVLSYNVWGIFISKHLDERMKAIAAHLPEYDVVCLQEQFEQRHCDVLFPDRNMFPYIERYVSCEYGSGLTIASKYPIVASMFLPFNSCGRAERVQEGDFLANKGIAAVRVAVPSALLRKPSARSDNEGDHSSPASPRGKAEMTTEVVICNTHFVAQYERYAQLKGGFWDETNAASRLTNAFTMADLACLLHGTASKRTPIVLCGDFNAGSDSHEVKLLHDYCIQRGVRLQAAISADQASYDAKNTYITDKTNEKLPILLDHIWFGDLALARPGRVVFNTEEKLGINGNARGHLSDHYGVAACFSHVEPVEEEPSTAIADANRETIAVAKFLTQEGDKYNLHFKLLLLAALVIFSVSAAGWVTKHPLVLTLAGAAAMFLVFLSVGHKRHESEYYYRVAADLLKKQK